MLLLSVIVAGQIKTRKAIANAAAADVAAGTGSVASAARIACGAATVAAAPAAAALGCLHVVFQVFVN